MASAWMSRRTTAVAIITALQIQALIGVKTKTVAAVVGQSIDVMCKYTAEIQPDAVRYFCVEDGHVCSTVLIRTAQHNQWIRNGRFSLYDNITGAFFLVRVNKVVLQDSRTYWCGVDVDSQADDITVIQLNVSQEYRPENLSHHTTEEPTHHNIMVDKHNLPLFLTAMMCMGALLFVFLFTFCLLLVVKKQRPRREMSTDHVPVMAGMRPEPEHHYRCSSLDQTDLSGFPPPPPDLCFHFTSKERESTVTVGVGEYVDVDVSERICQYQHLDLSRLEDHVYQSLHGNCGPKDRARVKE